MDVYALGNALCKKVLNLFIFLVVRVDRLHRSHPNDVPFSIRMSLELKQLLKALSLQSDRSINREMVYRIVHSMITHPEPLDIGEMDRLTDHGMALTLEGQP